MGRHKARKAIFVLGGIVGSYLLHFPLRLLEDWVMGQIEGRIAENFQNILGFVITWVSPVIVVFGAIWLGYRWKNPKLNIGNIEQKMVARTFSDGKSPKVALAELHFPKVVYHIEVEHPNKPQIHIEPLLISTGSMTLESAKVEIAGESMPCYDWGSRDLWPGGTYALGTHCKLPDNLSQGNHNIRLLIYANREWWASEWDTISYEPSTPDKEGSQP